MNNSSGTHTLSTLTRLLFTGVVIAVFCLGKVQAQVRLEQSGGIDPSLAQVFVRDILIAINHANLTGNYTVLRDLASPNFAIVNDPTKLAAIFQPIRAQQLDMRLVLFVDAVLERNTIIQPGNQLRISGYYPTPPRSIRFDLIFEPVDQRWRMLGVGVSSFQSARPSAAEPDLAISPGGQRQRIPVPQRRPTNIDG